MSRNLPARLMALAVVGVTLLALPLVGLLVRVPWSTVGGDIADSSSAIRLSLVVSLVAASLAVAIGVPLGFALARGTFRGQTLVRALVVLPIVLPPVVAGTALLAAFGRRGVAGRWLETALDITLPFTTPGAIVAAAFVAIPFVTLISEAGFRAVDVGLEEVAASLGAGPWRRFRRIALPRAAPALAAGAVLGWARALGEFGATITFAGNLPERTQTVPLAIYFELQRQPDAALSLSLVLLVVSALVLVVVRRSWAR